MVPVLSEQSTSMLANSSIATNLLTIASFLANAIAPIAIVTDKTAGKAAGIPETVNIKANCKVCNMLSCLIVATTKMIKTIAIANVIK